MTTPTRDNSAGQREFNVMIERDSEGYYVASVPQLRSYHTQAKSLDKRMHRVREAIEAGALDVPAAWRKSLGGEERRHLLPGFDDDE